MRSPSSLFAVSISALFAIVALLAGLACGTETIAPARLWRILSGAEAGLYSEVVLGLRLPRVLAAFGSGGLLALAGALMQAMLRNPLADPYVLGLAGGAGTGALAAMLAGMGAHWVLAGAWAGAVLAVTLVLGLSRAAFRFDIPIADADEPLRLLLTGVALAIAWAAIITLILALAPDSSLRGMLFWLMGSLDGGEDYRPSVVGLAVLSALAMVLGRELNVLALGTQRARALGVSAGRLRLAVLLLASAATALAVTTVGTLGFLGLIVPNAARAVTGNDQRRLLPVCVLVGGALLTAADTAARTIIAPMQLPVGAVVALIGVPVFIALLSRGVLHR